MEYLKIENPGVAPAEAFTVLGLSTKKNSPNQIGQFGSGNKNSIALCLRHRAAPVVFAGNLRLEFGTNEGQINDGLRTTYFDKVFVKYSGRDETGRTRNSTEDMGFVLDFGSHDWGQVSMALREFVSNAIDRAVEEGEYKFIQSRPACTKEELQAYRLLAKDYLNVNIEIVQENQVRAKSGTTRIFVPLTDDVKEFYENIGKWFLHFSEPDKLNQTVLSKTNRNIGNRRSAVIYRRGVRVREILSDTTSLFDYNLNNLPIDEARNFDDYRAKAYCAYAVGNSDSRTLSNVFNSLTHEGKFWEHEFEEYHLGYYADKEENKNNWQVAAAATWGEKAVVACTDVLAGSIRRKGYEPVKVPFAWSRAAEKYKCRSVVDVLSVDERDGREIIEATPIVKQAFNRVWNAIVKTGRDNGRPEPTLHCFIADASAAKTHGFYRAGGVYISSDLADGENNELLITVVEECAHHVTGALDETRELAEWGFSFAVSLLNQCTEQE